jgi:hypothetical protein
MLVRIKDGLRIRHSESVAGPTIILLLITVGLTLSASAWLSSGETIAQSLPAATLRQDRLTPQERGIIRLLTNGFSPPEVSGTSGQYRLVITRPSRSEEVVLQLKRENGELVQEIAMPEEKLNWTMLIELEAGSYTLTVVNHPQWVCRLTVQ